MKRIYISKIANGIRSMRLGTKTPEEVEVLSWVQKLAMLDEPRADEFQISYLKALKEYQKRFGRLNK